MAPKIEPIIQELPEEVVEIIASYLSLDSFLGLCSIHPNLARFSLKRVKNLKLKVLPACTQEYLKRYGIYVDSLDVSNSMALQSVLTESISRCEDLTVLNIVGTRLSCQEVVDIVKKLKQLHTLSFTLLGPIHQMEKDLPPAANEEAGEGSLASSSGREFPRLKKIYIEIVGNPSSVRFVADFMHRCVALEEAHIQMMIPRERPLPWPLPKYQPEDRLSRPDRVRMPRLFTLSVFNRHRKGIPFSHDVEVAQRFFDYYRPFGILGWVRDPVLGSRDTYIHEEGWRANGSLVSRVQTFLLNPDLREFRFFSPWAPPQKLRLVGWIWPEGETLEFSKNAGSWFDNMVELDLSDSHRFQNRAAKYLDSMFLPSSLRAIALPPCYFESRARQLPPGNREEPGAELGATEPARLEPFDERLGELRLEKFCLEGRQGCSLCGTLLFTESNMPDLRNLKYLKEIIINDARLDDSAYPLVANPNVCTLKIHALRPHGVHPAQSTDLTDFFPRCRSLRNLKLDLKSFPSQASLWASLATAENLKQLCLELRDVPKKIPIAELVEAELRTSISRVVERIQVVHIHFSLRFSPGAGSPFYLHEIVRDEMFSKPKDADGVKEFVGPDVNCLARIDSLEEPPTYYGRALCTPESFIARIDPIGWDID